MKHDHNPFVYKGNWRASIEVGSRAMSDVLSGRLWPKVDYAIEQDFTSDIAKLRNEHPLRIFVGEDDLLFKTSELAYALGTVGCRDLLQLVPGSHSSLLTRSGSAQLETVRQ